MAATRLSQFQEAKTDPKTSHQKKPFINKWRINDPMTRYIDRDVNFMKENRKGN